MIKRALGLVGAVLLVGVGAANAACPTKIGLILPMTGPIAPVAQGMLKAAELAAEQVNAAGGSNGCPVKLIVRDTQGQPSLAVDAARQIVDLEGARVVIGEALSGTTLAVLNSVTVPAGIPLISPTASAPTFSEIGAKTGLFYRANISDALQGIAAAHYAQREKSGAVSILAINNDWGQNLSRVFKAAYEKLGGSVKKIVFYNPDQPSYRAEVTSVIESQPDTLYFIGYVTEAARIVRDWISQGGTQRLLFPHNLNDANFVSAVGPKFLTQAIWLTPGESATPSLDNFRNAYQARYNESPNGPGRTSTYERRSAHRARYCGRQDRFRRQGDCRGLSQSDRSGGAGGLCGRSWNQGGARGHRRRQAGELRRRRGSAAVRRQWRHRRRVRHLEAR